uniref:DOG1 domain-containing protein n=1 Tax=Kalanchoe fedtschenkoi TaxID=63787 RepID=A0A7N0TL70_KALFE
GFQLCRLQCRIAALFTRKKSNRPFKDYYAEWLRTLKNTLLPLLSESISSPTPILSLIATHVESLHQHFQSYYEALDLAATHDVSQLLFPEWRNSLEKPFLWLGDFHPYLFTNLVRSFLEDDEEDEGEEEGDGDEGRSIKEVRRNLEVIGRSWRVSMAWKNSSKSLVSRMDQIECGLRLMVPALVNRWRDAQAGLIERIGAGWGTVDGRREGGKALIGQAVTAQMEELVSVFADANRLRSSVLSDILSALNVYQAALFLEGMAQFLVGFSDPDLLAEFERSKLTLS